MISMGSGSRRPRSSIRKALKKPANNAAWTTNQLGSMSKGDKKYEDEDGIHLFKPFFFAFTVDDLHSCVTDVRGRVVMWLDTYLHYSIPKQTWHS